MSVDISRSLTFTKNLVFSGRVLSKSLVVNKTWETRTAYVLSKSLTVNKTWETRTAYVLSKSLTVNKTWEGRTAYVLSKSLTVNKTWEGRTAYVLSKSLAIKKAFPNNIEKSLTIIRHVSYPADLPLEQTSQVWIEKIDGSVDSIEPLIVFLGGEPALICDAVNPKFLIGLTADFDIVFAYKPKNILPNQKYRFVLKRVS